MAEYMALGILGPSASQMGANPAEDRCRHLGGISLDRETAQHLEANSGNQFFAKRGKVAGKPGQGEISLGQTADIVRAGEKAGGGSFQLRDVLWLQVDQPFFRMLRHVLADPGGGNFDLFRRQL